MADKWRNITIVVLLVLPVVVVAYDLVAAFYGKSGATISEVILQTSLRRPLVPFAFGVLMGHLFFPQEIPPQFPSP
jgi:hypothetical protein